MEVILASQSPRRKELLARTGLPFTTEPSQVEENAPAGLSVRGTVRYLARIKAEDVFARHQDALVIGCDTIVALGEQIFGKPADAEAAAATLRLLSGKTHRVYTATHLCSPMGQRAFCSAALVTFCKLCEEEIAAYIATGEPMDKAGAYGIQGKGGLLVASCRGDFDTVVGFPTERFLREYNILTNH